MSGGESIGGFAIYSRKSRVTERGESVENQAELCRRYIKEYLCHGNDCNDSNVVVYEDEGFSGGNTNRPAFLRLMRDARAGLITHVVCYRLDRISRSIGDFTRLIEELGGLGIEFVSIKEQFDTQTPLGRAMMYIASVFSQLERETIAERIRDNMTELAKSGRWLGGVAPLGFKSVKTGEAGKCKFKLEPIESELRTVRRIFEFYEEYASLSRTERMLSEKGIRSRRGKSFTRLTVKNILMNPVYAAADKDSFNFFSANGSVLCCENADLFDGMRGIMAYNKTCGAGTAGRAASISAKRQLPRNISEWIVAKGEHCSVIEGSRWCAVQQMLMQNGSSSRSYSDTSKRSGGALGLLSGFLCCPACGSRMRARRGSASGSYYYRCSLKDTEGKDVCRSENINGSVLDNLIISRTSDVLAEACRHLSPPQMRKIRELGCADAFVSLSLNAEIKEKEAARERLITAIEHGEQSSAVELFVLRINELTEEIKALEDRRKLRGYDECMDSGGVAAAFSDSPAEFIQKLLSSVNTEKQRAVVLCVLKQVRV